MGNINRGGTGCIVTNSGGLPVHNPEPSTERGKRRHAARNEAKAKHAVTAWAKQRSKWPRCRPKTGSASMRDKGAVTG